MSCQAQLARESLFTSTFSAVDTDFFISTHKAGQTDPVFGVQ